MDKRKLFYDKKLLIEFIERNHIKVPILCGPFMHKVIIAEKLLPEIQNACLLSQEEFQKYIDGYGNKGGFPKSSIYERDEFVDKCIKNIEYPGRFKTLGWESVEPNPYIFLHKILDK